MSDDRTTIFKRFEMLKDLPPAALDDLARSCAWQSASPGRQIFSVNEQCGDVYFIVSGKVRVLLYSATDGKPVLFWTIGPFEMFGDVAGIDGKPRAVTVEAWEECTLAVLPKADFQRLLQAYPAFSFAVLRRLAGQVRVLTDRIYEFSTLTVQTRVYAELHRLAVLAGEQNGQALLSPAPLLVDLAAMISTHREAVSRAISRLQEDGILRREGFDIRILDIARLRKLLSEEKGE
jgi:CRP/FNR family transcriptional regulator, cyclic AMP receptor protein